jgi:hypothetical protein
MANLIVMNKVKADATYFDVVAPASYANGYLAVLGAQSADKTYAVAAPGAITDLEIVMVLAVPLSYAAEEVENDYVIATGEVVRAIVPYRGMVVSVPAANVTAGVAFAAEKFVIPVAGAGKMTSADALGGTEAVAFVIDQVYTKSGVSMLKLRCIKDN